MIARRIVLALAMLLWALIALLTFYVLFTQGPDVLVLISLVVVAVLGFGFFGALTERR
jgi:lipopolysaccharide export LptBFGC system permease protein LptF